jgi:hypothetical protein
VTYPVSLGSISFNMFFADDLALTSETAEGLQNSIDSLSGHCSSWKLKVSINKSNIMIFSRKTLKDTLTFYDNDGIIELAKEYEYLGVIFKTNGQLKYPANIKQSSQESIFCKLKRRLPFNNKLSVRSLLKLYESMIVPILTYSSEIWISDFNMCFKSADKCPFEKKYRISF